MSRCSYFKEKEDYLNRTESFFKGLLRDYAKSGIPLSNLFTQKFPKRLRKYKGNIHDEDKLQFKEYCVKTAVNLSNFLQNNRLTNIQESFQYKWDIRVTIGGLLDPNFLVEFSFKNAMDTQKSLDIYQLKDYIYNSVHNTTKDLLVMSVPTDSYFLVKYKDTDYTIERGFTKTAKHKIRRRGDHCLRCIKSCKPTYINGYSRLKLFK